MTDLPQYLVLTSSRLKWAFLLIGFLIFVSGGIALLLIGDETDAVLAWVCIALFGFFAVVSLVQLFNPARLELGPDGFRRTMNFRQSSYQWRDISEFRLFQYKSTKMIQFNVLGRPAGLLKKMAGNYESLGDNYSMKPQALMDLMNAFRQRALDSTQFR
ncbi:MAG: hypothetical protein EX271_08350 [Acidimicrobiales bacterium]|nr:hypothetical protein [Hyphomonadaceae bacterium]RZV41283.1 MAG: hypothetical protein EX271_08350 [Acidimicrobiales bacterium]